MQDEKLEEIYGTNEVQTPYFTFYEKASNVSPQRDFQPLTVLLALSMSSMAA